MISHEHKCIFIHISKCAGSSIEKAFGINLSDNTPNNNKNLYGWNYQYELFLQHATPQQLIDYKFITEDVWSDYYKFIIIRNPYSRALSDYLWLMRDMGIKDSFQNFINCKGRFEKILKVKDYKTYRGDHLTLQSDYFYFNGQKITYDRVLKFENLKEDLQILCDDLGLNKNMFADKVNVSKTNKHYSYFYDKFKKKLIDQKYKSDLELFNYSFEDKRSMFYKVIKNL